MKNCKPILLVEDDYVDAMTVRRALKDLNVMSPLIHSVNGEEALKCLEDQSNELPCVILLDLNMPKMSGTEFLSVIKMNKALKHIPVIVLTTSTEECDINEAYKYSVGGYIIKPVDYKNFKETIKTLDSYWTLSELPDRKVVIKDTTYETSSVS
jgi:CheY-like chemotaxis protein